MIISVRLVYIFDVMKRFTCNRLLKDVSSSHIVIISVRLDLLVYIVCLVTFNTRLPYLPEY